MSINTSQGPLRSARFGTLAGSALLAASLTLTACTGSQPPPSPSETSGANTGPSSMSPSAGASPGTSASPGASAPAASNPAPAPDAAGGIPELVENLAPSVVTIFTQGGLGSGVVYSEDGFP